MLAITQLIEDLRHDHIQFPRDAELREELGKLIEQMFVKKYPNQPAGLGNRDEQDVILVPGPTGTGKSASVREALTSVENTLSDADGQALKILSVKLPSPYSGKELARRVLKLMEVEMSDKLSEVELWEAVIFHFEANHVGIMHFDEFQRFSTIKTVGRADRATAADRLAATFNEILMHDRWPVALVVSGTEEMLPFWRTKNVDQVHRRTKFVVFDHMTEAYYPALAAAVQRYARKAGIDLALDTTDLPGRLCMAGENTLGIALEIAQEAVVSAVRDGDSALTMDHFAKVFARRTGTGRDRNPFVVDRWVGIGIREKVDLGERPGEGAN